MRIGQRYGASAFFLGGLSLIIAIVIFQQERFATFNPHAQPVVLSFLDRLGLVSAPDMRREVSLQAAYITSINDTNAFEFLRLHGWWFGGWAIALAMWSELQWEETLYMSGGFVLAASAMLFLGGYTLGLAVLTTGGAVTAMLRRRQQPGPSMERAAKQALYGRSFDAHIKS